MPTAGEPCEELTAKDCGKILTGVSEEGFQSSAMLDGQDQALSAEELEQRMLELSTSGDNAAAYSSAISQLDQWKNALRGTGKRGRYAAVEQELDDINHAVSRLDDLTAQVAAYEAQIPAAEKMSQMPSKSSRKRQRHLRCCLWQREKLPSGKNAKRGTSSQN